MLKEFREGQWRISGRLSTVRRAISRGVRRREGEVSLTSFDGEYRVLIAADERISFDERLQIAKSLIDDCSRSGPKAPVRTQGDRQRCVRGGQGGKVNTKPHPEPAQLDIAAQNGSKQ